MAPDPSSAPRPTDDSSAANEALAAERTGSLIDKETRARAYLLTSSSGRQLFLKVSESSHRTPDGWIDSRAVHTEILGGVGVGGHPWGMFVRTSNKAQEHGLLEHRPGAYRLTELGEKLWDDCDFRSRLERLR